MHPENPHTSREVGRVPPVRRQPLDQSAADPYHEDQLLGGCEVIPLFVWGCLCSVSGMWPVTRRVVGHRRQAAGFAQVGPLESV